MRILHVQETLAPKAGGPATVLPQLAKAQAAAGHEVIVATTNVDRPKGVYRDPGWDTLGDGAVPVFYAPVQFEPLRVSFNLVAYFRRAIPTFDIVHVHGLYRFPVTSAAYLSRRYGVPYIIRPHGSLDPYLYDKSTRGNLRLKRLYERWFDLPNLNAADAIHYTAEDERQRASFLELRSPSFVIPNGLEWENFSALPERGALRSRWGVGDAPLVLFLGRLHAQKGLDLLVPAFGALRQVRPDACLVIAGPDSDGYGQRVRALVAEHRLETAVRFVGPLDRAEVLQAYVDADVFALPSYVENFGMTVVEAMACALPVVISDQVNIHVDISNASAGLVTRCDADEFASALVALVGDADRCAAMGDAGRRFVQQHYAWPAIVEALTKEYLTLVERGRGAVDSPSADRACRSEDPT